MNDIESQLQRIEAKLDRLLGMSVLSKPVFRVRDTVTKETANQVAQLMVEQQERLMRNA